MTEWRVPPTDAMSTPRVLVVDDEQQLRAILSDALTHWGYEATAVSTGQEALDLLKNQLFDVALVDIRMPGMDGLTLLEAIKRRDPALEVIMVTGVQRTAQYASLLASSPPCIWTLLNTLLDEIPLLYSSLS